MALTQTLATTPLSPSFRRGAAGLVLAALGLVSSLAVLPHRAEMADAGIAVVRHFADHFAASRESADEFSADPSQLNCLNNRRFCARQTPLAQGD